MSRGVNSKTLVSRKMKVLKEFYIVDEENKNEIRAYLEEALRKYPERDPEIVLDQAASLLIQRKLNSGEED